MLRRSDRNACLDITSSIKLEQEKSACQGPQVFPVEQMLATRLRLADV